MEPERGMELGVWIGTGNVDRRGKWEWEWEQCPVKYDNEMEIKHHFQSNCQQLQEIECLAKHHNGR